MHINPDHFLETPEGRVFTHERNSVAWKQSFAAFDEALHTKTSRTVVYVMVGCQNAGKSTWAQAMHEQEPDAIIFDAILVKKSEREPILRAAARHQVPAIAVWVRTPLDVCVERNRARPADQIVNEQGMRNVFAALEPPELSEGFREVIEVPYRGPRVHAGR